MGMTAEKLTDEPIIIITYTAPFEPQADLKAAAEATAEHIQGGETIYRVDDTREITLNFGDLVQAMATAAQNSPGSARDPHVQAMLVGTNKLIEIGSKAMQQAQYGGLNVPLFTSTEDALDHARRQIDAA